MALELFYAVELTAPRPGVWGESLNAGWAGKRKIMSAIKTGIKSNVRDALAGSSADSRPDLVFGTGEYRVDLMDGKTPAEVVAIMKTIGKQMIEKADEANEAEAWWSNEAEAWWLMIVEASEIVSGYMEKNGLNELTEEVIEKAYSELSVLDTDVKSGIKCNVRDALVAFHLPYLPKAI